jgi:hypothetical protein
MVIIPPKFETATLRGLKLSSKDSNPKKHSSEAKVAGDHV